MYVFANRIVNEDEVDASRRSEVVVGWRVLILILHPPLFLNATSNILEWSV